MWEEKQIGHPERRGCQSFMAAVKIPISRMAPQVDNGRFSAE